MKPISGNSFYIHHTDIFPLSLCLKCQTYQYSGAEKYLGNILLFDMFPIWNPLIGRIEYQPMFVSRYGGKSYPLTRVITLIKP